MPFEEPPADVSGAAEDVSGGTGVPLDEPTAGVSGAAEDVSVKVDVPVRVIVLVTVA